MHRGIIIGTIVVAILMSMHLACMGRAVIPDLVPDLVIPDADKGSPPFCRRDLPCRADGGDYVDDSMPNFCKAPLRSSKIRT